MTHPKIRQWLFLYVAGLLPYVALAGDLPPPLAPEVSDVATLPPSTPHRFVTVGRSGSVIFDGDTGKIQGSIPSGYIANIAIAPDNSRFYVSETYWTHGARGTRDDLLTIYDGKTLNLIKEIPLPGRALVGKVQNFDLNAAGTRAYVYLLSPAGAVTWVDLKKQKVGGTVEVPGCALVFPWGDTGFSSLCGDGSLASVVVPESGKPTVTHTKPFFDANVDPRASSIVLLGRRSSSRTPASFIKPSSASIRWWANPGRSKPRPATRWPARVFKNSPGVPGARNSPLTTRRPASYSC